MSQQMKMATDRAVGQTGSRRDSLKIYLPMNMMNVPTKLSVRRRTETFRKFKWYRRNITCGAKICGASHSRCINEIGDGGSSMHHFKIVHID